MLFGRRRGNPPPDADAFAAAALDQLDALYGSAVRLTRNADSAQDLVQDTYLKALRARDRFEPGTNLKAWLFTILHNTWRNRRRDEARAKVETNSDIVDLAAEGDLDPVAAPGETPETLLLKASMDVDLRAALDALPEAFREAVWLRDVDELSYLEIAGVLQVPIGTVMSRISRGRTQLYRTLMARRPAPSR
jgi:RNA polymerase sigma-70 factor (ECF subfamily)